ncbi:MAG: hypothetical protein ACXABY_15300 [Candidatus Thorarchaeota archaeon]|jgi:hypothetical protein
MAIIDYADLTECLSTDGFPDRADGWKLKHTDSGKQYLRVTGVWVDMELGLSFAPPTKSGTITTDGAGQASIVFGQPFIDDAYTVALTCADNGTQVVVAHVVDKSASGFSIYTRSARSGQLAGSITVSWLATRNYNE